MFVQEQHGKRRGQAEPNQDQGGKPVPTSDLVFPLVIEDHWLGLLQLPHLECDQ